MYTFQEITAKLAEFWHHQGCSVLQPHDVEKGAATFNPHTFFRCLGPEPYHAAYIEPCRRPKDGRYAENPNRLQHYFQYQVILKPSPYNIQDLYLQSLEAIGFNLKDHDIRFVHDDWEQPTIGAWGLGWEVWIDGQECSQFTYFQAVAGIPLKPITGEITYGIERLALYLQKKKSLFDLQWNKTLTYGDIYRQNEVEWSTYNFEVSDAPMWFSLFTAYEKEAKRLVEVKLPIPALDFVMKASHAFNMLDARGAISVTERASYIAQIRDIAKQVAECYLASREKMGYPLLQKGSCQISPLAPIPRKDGINTNKGKPQTFLLEIGTEELPAIFVQIGLDGLERQMKQLFEKERISYSSLKAMGTPRRLAVIVEGLSHEREASSQEKKGPSVAASFDNEGKATPAALGFFRQIGAPTTTLQEIEKGSVPNIHIEEIKGTKYLFATVHTPSVMTQEILKQALPQLVLGLEFPKKMRWADLDFSFARPIRWIVSLFGDEVVSFDVGPLHASSFSFGHRQLSPDMFELKHASEYQEMLRKKNVIVDCEERKKLIEQQVHDLEKKEGVVIASQDRIIPQVLHLVEKPFLTMTDFDASFLRAPQEVLICEMCEHQKYFPVMNNDGKLQNRFVITANVPPTSSIQSGNRNVLSARLTDGVFLFEHDLKTSLEGFAEKLKGIVFQSGLGTMHDKALRLQREVQAVAPFVLGAKVEHAQEAALLAKADLATEVVQEFPELQGVMGRIYATHQNKHTEVAQAIDEHWMPRGENAPLPQSKTGIVLSISEKIDNLISFFGLGLKPTSSSDPFALRRQALGLVKIIIRNNLNIALRPLLQQCICFFPESFQKKKSEIVNEIIAFLHPRVRSLLVEEGFTKGEIDACLLMRDDDIFDIYSRVKTLHVFSAGHKDFNQIIEVYKRCRGQTNGFAPVILQEELLLEPAERELYNAIKKRKEPFTKLLHEHQYEHVLVILSELQPYLSDLFDKVKILADDPKIQANRIALLQEVSSLFDLIADFQKIQ